jgi:hypothetical protein
LTKAGQSWQRLALGLYGRCRLARAITPGAWSFLRYAELAIHLLRRRLAASDYSGGTLVTGIDADDAFSISTRCSSSM